MLQRLFIQNFATIKKQTIEFDPGFIAITGETGAGKSIFIKAIKLVLGGKSSRDFIRTGEKYILVEASFEIKSHPDISTLLDSIGIEFTGALTIRRKVTKSGKNSVFINDCSVNLNTLAELGKYLIDLNGQHSQQSLLQPAIHIDYLDDYLQITADVLKFGSDYQELLNIKKQVAQLKSRVAETVREADFLQFQINEIEAADLTEEEVGQLDQEYQVLNHAEKLIETISPVSDWADASGSPLETVSTAIYTIEDLIKYDQRLEKISSEMKSGFIILEEAFQSLSRYRDKIEANPGRLEEINQRLSQIDQLKRKYGATVSDILKFLAAQKQKLSELSASDENLKTLEINLEQLQAELEKRAGIFSKQRLQSKKAFEESVLKHLKALGLEKSIFEVAIQIDQNEEKSSLYAKGKDHLEFLITTNPGHPVKPLSKIASGGELSRILLAIKSIVKSDQSAHTFIFDEIDTGISGRISKTVGDKLKELGENKQVICITHSPQIASMADTHYRVDKEMKQNEAVTSILKLEHSERVMEIAQFLASHEITENTISAAEEMIKGETE